MSKIILLRIYIIVKLIKTMINKEQNELMKRSMKYIIMSLILFFAFKYASSTKLQNKDALILMIIGVVTFTVLDLCFPAISYTKQKKE